MAISSANAASASATIPVLNSTSRDCPCHEYLIKLVNPRKKSDYEIVRLKSKRKYESVDKLKEQILEEFTEKVMGPLKLGYIEPGHGLRGKQQWLSLNDDLMRMYELYQSKKEITLWCIGEAVTVGSKRALDEVENQVNKVAKKSSAGYVKHVDRVVEVNEIENQLKVKHGIVSIKMHNIEHGQT